MEGKATGVHLKAHGKGKGVVLTPSMSARRLGSQVIGEPLMLLELVSSTVDPRASPVSKIVRNQAELADVLVKNKFFKKIDSRVRARIKKWKDEASNSDDKSHPFTTAKPHSDSARRATDRWNHFMSR